MAENKSAPEQCVAVQELIDYISDLSEEAYCAAWMDAVEFALWRRVTDGPGRYGRLDVNEVHIQRLRELSQKCGGWVYWDESTNETYLPSNEWKVLYDAWQRSGRRPEGDH